MPLKQGKSRATISANIATEIRAGKRPDVAAAIAYSTARRSGGSMAKKVPTSTTATTDTESGVKPYRGTDYQPSVDRVREVLGGGTAEKTYPFHSKIADTAKDLAGQAISGIKRAVTGTPDTSAVDRSIAEKKRVNSYLRKRPLG